ncbi:MAG TPA: hypothetical protein VG847_09480 [Chitinophagaceae bacterium]|nr:hypothetical protein [Chitinophagaceae bacterium]
MKKILTLVFCLGMVSLSFAQYDPGHRDNGYAFSREHAGRDHYFGSREFQIQKINRDIDSKIIAVQHDWSLTRHQKKVTIKALEHERNREIRMINERFHRMNRDFDPGWDHR